MIIIIMLLNHNFCVPLKLFFFPVDFIVSVFIVLSYILLNIMRFIVSLNSAHLFLFCESTFYKALH